MALTFMCDEGVSPRIVGALQELYPEHTYLRVREEFGPGTPDPTWVPVCAEKGYIGLSADRSMVRNSAKRRAYLEAGFTAVIAPQLSQLPFKEQHIMVFKFWEDIVEAVSRRKVPTIFKLTSRAGIREWESL